MLLGAFGLELEPFLLQLERFFVKLSAFLLAVGKESASNKHLNALYAKKLNCKKQVPTVSEKFPQMILSGNSEMTLLETKSHEIF